MSMETVDPEAWTFPFPKFRRGIITQTGVFAPSVADELPPWQKQPQPDVNPFTILCASEDLQLTMNLHVGKYLIAPKVYSRGHGRNVRAPVVVTQDFDCDGGCDFGTVYVSAGGDVSFGSGTHISHLIVGPGVTITLGERCSVDNFSYYVQGPVLYVPDNQPLNVAPISEVDADDVMHEVHQIFHEVTESYQQALTELES